MDRFMSKPRVVSVGQCGVDHGAISRFLQTGFGAQTIAADSAEEMLDLLDDGDVTLVLVNRVLDLDGTRGVDVIRTLKADPRGANVATMLVSNFASAQAEAVAVGALPGFGKADIGRQTASQALEPILGTSGQ